jgi:hypothetical protein
VLRDLPAAVRFFATRGWRHTHDTLDLVTDLARYRPPPVAGQRAASVGVTITRASSADVASGLALEATTFPTWARWFSAASPEDILAVRDGSGNIAGTLLFQGPVRIPYSRRCSTRPPGPSAALAWHPRCRVTGRVAGGRLEAKHSDARPCSRDDYLSRW